LEIAKNGTQSSQATSVVGAEMHHSGNASCWLSYVFTLAGVFSQPATSQAWGIE